MSTQQDTPPIETLAAGQAARLDLIRSPRLILAQVWEEVETWNALPSCSLWHSAILFHQSEFTYEGCETLSE